MENFFKRKIPTVAFLLAIVFILALAVGCGEQTEPATTPSGTQPQGEQETSNLPELVNIGTNQVGQSFHIAGTAIASVVDKYSPIRAKVIPLAGSLEWYPMMPTGEIDLGIVGDYEAWAALHGEEDFDTLSNGQGFDTRLVASGNHLLAGILATKDFNYTGPESLKGKRYTVTYGAAGLIVKKQPYAYLANLGIDPSEVTDVPLQSASKDGPEALLDGRVDVASDVSLTALGVQEVEAAKGAKFISLDPSPEAIERARKYIPTFDVALVEPGPVGIVEPTYMMEYAIYLVTRTDLSDEAVYEIIKAMWENNEELTSSPKPADEWTTDQFVDPKAAIPYHPGAVKFYKEVNAWPADMETKQTQLLAELGR